MSILNGATAEALVLAVSGVVVNPTVNRVLIDFVKYSLLEMPEPLGDVAVPDIVRGEPPGKPHDAAVLVGLHGIAELAIMRLRRDFDEDWPSDACGEVYTRIKASTGQLSHVFTDDVGRMLFLLGVPAINASWSDPFDPQHWLVRGDQVALGLDPPLMTAADLVRVIVAHEVASRVLTRDGERGAAWTIAYRKCRDALGLSREEVGTRTLRALWRENDHSRLTLDCADRFERMLIGIEPLEFDDEILGILIAASRNLHQTA